MLKVQLRLDNHSKKLSVDETEMIVTIDLYRSGESEYDSMNGARLKDIADLFLDSGLEKKKRIALSRKVELMK